LVKGYRGIGGVDLEDRGRIELDDRRVPTESWVGFRDNEGRGRGKRDREDCEETVVMILGGRTEGIRGIEGFWEARGKEVCVSLDLEGGGREREREREWRGTGLT